MKVAVALLTCDRVAYTERTVKSLLEHNDRKSLHLYYGDDASKDTGVHNLLGKFGFKCLVQHEQRQGCSQTTEHLLQAVLFRSFPECNLVLLLQNDWESVKAIDMKLVDEVFSAPTVKCLRLYGQWKDRERKLGASDANLGLPEQEKVAWVSREVQGEKIESGVIHWCFCPSIVRTDCAVAWTRGAKRESDVMKASMRVPFTTVRYVENIMYHFGDETTPDGVFGRKR